MPCPAVCNEDTLLKEGKNNLLKFIIVLLITIALISVSWDYIASMAKLISTLDLKVVISLVALIGAGVAAIAYLWPEATLSRYTFTNFFGSIKACIRCKLCNREEAGTKPGKIVALADAIEKNRKREEEEAKAETLKGWWA